MLIAVALLGLALGSTGCTAAQVQQDAAIFETEAHTLAVDLADGMDTLASNPAAVDSVEAFVGPLVAKNAALKKANDEFLVLWTAYKAGKVGPNGSPVTVAELRAAVSIIESLTAPTPAAQAASRRQMARRVATGK
jgi:hypothetical protein